MLCPELKISKERPLGGNGNPYVFHTYPYGKLETYLQHEYSEEPFHTHNGRVLCMTSSELLHMLDPRKCPQTHSWLV